MIPHTCQGYEFIKCPLAETLPTGEILFSHLDKMAKIAYTDCIGNMSNTTQKPTDYSIGFFMNLFKSGLHQFPASLGRIAPIIHMPDGIRVYKITHI